MKHNNWRSRGRIRQQCQNKTILTGTGEFQSLNGKTKEPNKNKKTAPQSTANPRCPHSTTTIEETPGEAHGSRACGEQSISNVSFDVTLNPHF